MAAQAPAADAAVDSALAALYVQDALAGRLEHGLAAASFKPAWVQRCFHVHCSAVWTCFIYACALGHMALTFGEPSASLDEGSGDWGVGVLIADVLISLRVERTGRKGSRWQSGD